MQEEKRTVTMLFPRTVRLTVTHDKVVSFREGVQEVPAELADHWYLKSSGVKPYTPAAPLPVHAAPDAPEDDEDAEDAEDSSAGNTPPAKERPSGKRRK